MMLAELLRAANMRLNDAAIDTPALDARLLFTHALKCSQEDIIAHSERSLSEKEIARIDALVARRCVREPMSHILGKKEFFGREFVVTRDVLTPRADSETVVEVVLCEVASGQWRVASEKSEVVESEQGLNEKTLITCHSPPLTILDLGTGSGCLLLTLLAEISNARGIGVDCSDAALEIARQNAKNLVLESRATFVRSHWAAAISGVFDIIISNPPYIPKSALRALMPEVRDFEPHLALLGGEDGLDCYRELAKQVVRLLAPSGIAVFEIGQGQHEAVAEIMKKAGLARSETKLDLSGIPRAVTCSR